MRRTPLVAAEISRSDIARAARILWIRSRREATSLLAGEYASAFRGGGIEFEESRPYALGDDVRSFDWNATARTGEPWVKRFREERSRTVLLALDVSASMHFGSGSRTKATHAAHAAALLAAAAGRAGDRLGFVAYGGEALEAVPPGRGEAHSWRVIRGAVMAARAAPRRGRLAGALAWIRQHARGRAVLVVLSDFREPGLFEEAASTTRGNLSALARRHDVVAAICEDPRERELPNAGPVRIHDPEHPGRWLLIRTQRREVRERYREAAAAWRRRLERRLHQAGVDFVRLPTEVDPLRALSHFFRERSAQTRRAS